jgi:hypothetical protein
MPSLKFFKGVLVPNFNKTFGRGLVLMAVPRSQESFSTVGTKLSTWLNILRPGANIMAEGRKRRGGGIFRGMIALFQPFPAAEIHGPRLNVPNILSIRRL